MNLFGVKCKEVSGVVITREQAVQMIVDHAAEFVKDEAYIRECLTNGTPTPLELCSGTPLADRALGELVEIMEHLGMIDSIDDIDTILIAETDETKRSEFYQSVIVR